jgi:enoyl-CoA hydratase/carnithine racemase
MYKNFVVDRDDKIVVITLNRPEKRNPIHEEMLSEFERIVMSLRDDANSRVVILTGTGNSFCAGADLSLVKGVTDPAERQRLFALARHRRARLIGRTFPLLENLEQVSIAAINGYAIGGGWGLALACDFRLAVPGAQFWLPEVDLGGTVRHRHYQPFGEHRRDGTGQGNHHHRRSVQRRGVALLGHD